VNLTKITVEVKQHLNSTLCPTGGAINCVNVSGYGTLVLIIFYFFKIFEVHIERYNRREFRNIQKLR